MNLIFKNIKGGDAGEHKENFLIKVT